MFARPSMVPSGAISKVVAAESQPAPGVKTSGAR